MMNASVSVGFLQLLLVGVSQLYLPPQDEIQTLIRKLASDNIEERDAAAKALVKLGRPARPAVFEATKHSNEELSRRARDVLEALDSRVDSTLLFLERARSEESGSYSRLLRRLQAWTSTVFDGKSWDGIPETLAGLGLRFDSLRDYSEDQRRTSYRYLLKQDAVKMPGGALVSAWITFDVGREYGGQTRTLFMIRSASISLGLEINESVRGLATRPTFGKDTAIQLAMSDKRFEEAMADFPFIRSIEMTYGPQYRKGTDEYSSGINVRFDLGSEGNIWHSSYECDLVSGLDPVRNSRGESREPSFVPVDSLRIDRAGGGGKSGPLGHGLKRVDLPSLREPFVYSGFSKRFYRSAYTSLDLAELPPSTECVQIQLPNCSAKQLRELVRLKSLSFLDLSGCVIDDEGAKVVASVSTLEELWLSGRGLSDQGLKSLSPLANLTQLHVADAPHLTDDSLIVLKCFPKLTTLSLGSWTKLTNEGMKHVGAKTGLTRLTIASIRQMSDSGFAHITGLKALRSLEVRFQDRLTRLSAASISQLQNLQELWLTSCQVDDSWLIEIGRVHSLQYLFSYQSGQITNLGLLALKGMKDLRRLNVDGRVTEAGMGALQAMLSGEYVCY